MYSAVSLVSVESGDSIHNYHGLDKTTCTSEDKIAIFGY